MTTHQAISPVDTTAVRRDFPILDRTMQGKPLVYLDSAATSQKPRQVIEALTSYYESSNANVHRGVYELAEEATAAYEAARATVARCINASPEECIFTRNASEAINLVAYTWARQNVRAGDAVLITPMEHHSNIVPWQLLTQSAGAELRYADLMPDGALDLESIVSHLADGRVKLVACTYISNVLGSIIPVAEVARLAHDAGALLLVDAAQAVPHRPVDVRALGVDFLAFTGHKMLGPMGIGVLYGRRSLLEAMPPFLGGGEMIGRVEEHHVSWNELPWKFEAGTPSVGDAVGLGRAIEYLETIGLEAIEEHDRMLASYALERLQEIDGLRIHGPEERGALVAFTLEGVHPHDLASVLDEQGIAVRAGNHCAQPLHIRLGVVATTRASFYLYNTIEEIDSLVEGVRLAAKILAP